MPLPTHKRILLIGGNFSPELTGIGKYNGEMIELLSGKGYDCTVITSYPYYPHWKVQKPYVRQAFWFTREIQKLEGMQEVCIYRCPQYVPRRPSGAKRMLLDLSFCFFAFFKLMQLLFHRRYDYVITVVPCFQLGLLGLIYKWIRGGKFLYHIQDLQIDAAAELRMIRSRTLLRILFRIERFIISKADVVSSISEGMIRKIRDKFKREVIYFPNWVDTNSFYPMTEKETLKQEFNLDPENTIILYSGAIGEKQGLENILHAAHSLRHIQRLTFVVCGMGPYKKKLEELRTQMGLTNLVFLPLQPMEKLNHFLNMPDIHLVLQKGNASDLVMPSKLTTILSVGGLTIVSAQSGSNLHEIIEANKMGILIPPDDPQSLAMSIERSLKSNCEQIKLNARRYAEKFLAIEPAFARYMHHIS
jgi:colanic acid biosynthesis glycosyl transferase WcaI